jgi:hypothetical protein
MNGKLGNFIKDVFPNCKPDLYAAFFERSSGLVRQNGSVAMVFMHAWMFLSSFEKFRKELLANGSITSMAHLGARGFDTIGGEVVSTAAFTYQKGRNPLSTGVYLDLTDGMSESEKSRIAKEAIAATAHPSRHMASKERFEKIPGELIAYWISDAASDAFDLDKLENFAPSKQGMATSDNDRFLRLWHEVPVSGMKLDCPSHEASKTADEKWYPYNKGGGFRRWFGNNEHVVNWQYDGTEVRAFVDEINKLRPGGRLKNQDRYFKESLTYTAI